MSDIPAVDVATMVETPRTTVTDISVKPTLVYVPTQVDTQVFPSKVKLARPVYGTFSLVVANVKTHLTLSPAGISGSRGLQCCIEKAPVD